jgi:protein-disulfide isomerase
MRYVLFHKGSEEVARMLEASRKQNLFPQVLEAVLDAQPEWHDDPKVLKAWDAAARAGLDVEKARTEMGSSAIDAVLKRDMEDAKKIGIRGTPTFYVNTQPLVELGPEPLRNLVLSEIKQARN